MRLKASARKKEIRLSAKPPTFRLSWESVSSEVSFGIDNLSTSLEIMDARDVDLPGIGL